MRSTIEKTSEKKLDSLDSKRRRSAKLFRKQIGTLSEKVEEGILFFQNYRKTELGRNRSNYAWKFLLLMVFSIIFVAKYPSIYRKEFSRGEDILLKDLSDSGTSLENFAYKEKGGAAFSKKDWDTAVINYSLASQLEPNDPESLIYLNNSKVKRTGTPLTMAVVVPVSSQPEIAKEWLRGIALVQHEFNHSQIPPDRPIEVMIIDGSILNPNIAINLILRRVKGVFVYGSDKTIHSVIEDFTKVRSLMIPTPPILSLSNIEIHHNANESNQILAREISNNYSNYLNKAGEKLAIELNSRGMSRVAIYYDSESSENEIFRKGFVDKFKQFNGAVLNGDGKKIDANFDVNSALDNVIKYKAQAIFLASSNVNHAIDIARANEKLADESDLVTSNEKLADESDREKLLLVGRENLYSPTLLLEGSSAVKEMVLAVPWSWRPCGAELPCADPFSEKAAKFWRGRVSWRTRAAYSMSHGLAHAIANGESDIEVHEHFRKEVEGFYDPQNVSLVKVNRGSDGPISLRRGKSAYQFDVVD